MKLSFIKTAQILGVFLAIQILAGGIAFAHDFAGGQPTLGMVNETPKELSNVGITEHLGSQVNLDMPVTNEKGEAAHLRDYFRDGKPVLLDLAYYECPSLCNFHLNGLLDAFKAMKEPLGKDFNVVVVSIEPKETYEIAAAKRLAYLKAYNRPEGDDGWHFLIAKPEDVKALAKQVGFNYHWDEEQKQWAHVSAAYVTTPQGVISRYLYGIVFDPKTVRLSMVEATDGKIATISDKLILYCFHFDPKAAKYSLAAFNVVRAGGVMILVVLAAFMMPFWRRNQREEESQGDAP